MAGILLVTFLAVALLFIFFSIPSKFCFRFICFLFFFYFLKIPRQIKGLRSSRKVRKLVEIQKSNKLVLSKKYISLKTRGSEKLPHSKCSYSRLSFCNQLSNTHVSVITLSNDKYRRKNSQRITVRSSCWIDLTLFISGVCKYAWLTVIFIGQFVSKKIFGEIWR